MAEQIALVVHTLGFGKRKLAEICGGMAAGERGSGGSTGTIAASRNGPGWSSPPTVVENCSAMEGKSAAAGAANWRSRVQHVKSTRGGDDPNTTQEDSMPNGGSDCCGTCWFNRSLGGQRGSANFNRDTPIARSAIWTSRTRSIPIVQITPITDQAETPFQLGRYTFTALLALWGRAGAKSGSPRRTRKRFANTCSISSAGRGSTPTRATTSLRAQRTLRPSRNCLNGVMRGSFQRWKKLLSARKRNAFAPTSRRP